ncbi:hypothetical protein ACLOJK_028540, partial [Asimina triloba]
MLISNQINLLKPSQSLSFGSGKRNCKISFLLRGVSEKIHGLSPISTTNSNAPHKLSIFSSNKAYLRLPKSSDEMFFSHPTPPMAKTPFGCEKPKGLWTSCQQNKQIRKRRGKLEGGKWDEGKMRGRENGGRKEKWEGGKM